MQYNVVGYALYKSKDTPNILPDVTLQVSCWISATAFRVDEQLVDDQIVHYEEIQSWKEWRAFPLKSPVQKASHIRVRIRSLHLNTPLHEIIGDIIPFKSGKSGFGFFSDRPQTVWNKAHRAVLAALSHARSATDTAAAAVRLAASLFLAYPPLLLMPAAVFAFAWLQHGLEAAFRGTVLGIAAFSAGWPARRAGAS